MFKSIFTLTIVILVLHHTVNLTDEHIIRILLFAGLAIAADLIFDAWKGV
ncbi:MAG: hypothetical protein ACW98X_21505 [Promethearchaeota archaeon]|jgi:hypothetical protein